MGRGRNRGGAAQASAPATSQHAGAGPETGEQSRSQTSPTTHAVTEQDEDAILDIRMSEEESEEEIVRSKPPRANRPTSSDQLVDLRKKLLKAKFNLAKALSHLSFISECRGIQVTPVGLRVQVQCHALLKDYSTVEEAFKNTRNRAEDSFLTNLEKHYSLLEKSLTKEIEDIQAEIDQALPLITERAALALHDERCRKMETDLTAFKAELQKKKDRKIIHLRTPPAQRGATRGVGRGRPRGGLGRGAQRDAAPLPSSNLTSILGELLRHLQETQQADDQPLSTGRGRGRGRSRRGFGYGGNP